MACEARDRQPGIPLKYIVSRLLALATMALATDESLQIDSYIYIYI